MGNGLEVRRQNGGQATGLSPLCLSETDFSVFANPLGHSTLEMTRRYANLMTEDLQAVHQKITTHLINTPLPKKL